MVSPLQTNSLWPQHVIKDASYIAWESKQWEPGTWTLNQEGNYGKIHGPWSLLFLQSCSSLDWHPILHCSISTLFWEFFLQRLFQKKLTCPVMSSGSYLPLHNLAEYSDGWFASCVHTQGGQQQIWTWLLCLDIHSYFFPKPLSCLEGCLAGRFKWRKFNEFYRSFMRSMICHPYLLNWLNLPGIQEIHLWCSQTGLSLLGYRKMT